MKACLARIGNSRGIRLPGALLQEAGLTGEVEVRVRQGAVVITATGKPGTGWAKAAKQLHKRGEDRLVE